MLGVPLVTVLLVLYLLFAVLLGGLTWWLRPREKSASITIHGDGEAWLNSVQLELSRLTNHEFFVQTPKTAVVRTSFRQGWTVIVAILAFPFGLIALLVRDRAVGTIIVSQESPSKVQIGGRFTREAIRAINRTIS